MVFPFIPSLLRGLSFSVMLATTLSVDTASILTTSLFAACLLSVESVQSSTFRELKAIYYVLKSNAQAMKHKKIKVFSDNENATRIVMSGSPKPHLQSLAKDIFQLCFLNDIQIDTQWLPRDENQIADCLSRFIDKDDWSLNSEVFAELDAKWGPHTVDRFSSHYNYQVPRFNSKFMSPGCEAVDAFSQDWRSENNWICPPVSLIMDIVRHAQACSAAGTLIIPEWPSAIFWPTLKSSARGFAPFVKDYSYLPRRYDLVVPGPGQKLYYRDKPSVFFGCPKFRLIAIRIDFR